MAIYKVQGPNGEIITIEGPDGADPNLVIAQAQSLYKPKEKSATDYVKDFGKATASLADTGLNAVTGMLDYAAYPLARAFGRSPEQATQETTSPKDVIGSAFGITQDPAYQSELSRRMMTGMGQGIENYAVKPLANATGLPEQDVNSMVGSAMLGAGAKAQPYINRAGQKVAQGMYAAEPYIAEALKAPVKAPYQFAKGAIEGLVNKEYNPATSAMVPLRDTYTPPPAAQRFMGQLPGVPEQSLSQLESQARPTSELVGSRTGQIAQSISPKTLAGETLVPLQGQGMQAWGERVGRGVRTNPLQAMGEVGLTALTGIPFKTIGQGIGELGARYLGAKTGFMPGFSDKLTQAQGRAGIQGQMPQTPLLTNNPSAPGPVNPSTMYVSPEGVAGSNMNQVSQAGAQQKYAPQPVPQTPAQVAQQAAASKIISPVAPTPQSIPQIAASKIEGAPPVQAAPIQAPTRTPQQQAILDQIRARGAQPGSMTSTPPVAGPVAPTSIESLPNERWTPAEKLALERAKLQENPPPAMTAADETTMKKETQQTGKTASQYRGEVVTEWVKGNYLVEGTPLDKSKNAYDGSNKTRGQVKRLLAAGIDEIPVLDGVTPAQTINAIITHLDNKQKTPNKVKTKTIADAQTDLSTNDLKSIFKTETGLDLDIDKIKEGIFGKHRMELPPNSNDLLKQKTAKEVKDAAKIYKEAYDGKMLFENAFAARNQTIPTYWQLRDVLGEDLSYGNKAFNDLAKMSSAEVQARVDAYIQKNPDRTFNKTELVNDTTLENVDYVNPPPNVSKMMTPEDTFKALKQNVPRSEMGLTEGKIFDMTQAERNTYRKTLTAQLNSPKLYPMDKQLIENALKLIDKYDFK